MRRKKREKDRNNSLSVDGNVEDSNVVIGDNNTFHETNLTVNNASYYEQEEHDYHDIFDKARDDFSREIRETILISIFTSLCLILGWSHVGDFQEFIPYPTALLTAMIFSAFGISHLGLRHSFLVGSWVGIAFSVWAYIAKRYTIMDYLVSDMIIIAILGNSLLGVIFGAVIGFYISVRRPLDI